MSGSSRYPAAEASEYLPQFDTLMAGTWRINAQGYLSTRRVIDGKMFRITQHRLVLQKKLGRALSTGEVARHIDSCRTNNEPDNLAAMLEPDHAREHLMERIASGAQMKNPYRAPTVTLNCASCGTAFTKFKHLLTNNVKKGQRPCCSRSCAAKFSRVEA